VSVGEGGRRIRSRDLGVSHALKPGANLELTFRVVRVALLSNHYIYFPRIRYLKITRQGGVFDEENRSLCFAS
jgi:hypothetical protein